MWRLWHCRHPGRRAGSREHPPGRECPLGPPDRVEATVNRSLRSTPLLTIAATLLVSIVAAPARADDTAPRPADVVVHDVWARATPAGAKMGAIYLTLE